jgi:hypothetical protein
LRPTKRPLCWIQIIKVQKRIWKELSKRLKSDGHSFFHFHTHKMFYITFCIQIIAWSYKNINVFVRADSICLWKMYLTFLEKSNF